MCFVVLLVVFECSGDHGDLHELTHSFPTRRSSDLLSISASLASAAASTMNERASAAFSASSAGISPYSNTVPWDAVSQGTVFEYGEDRKSTRLNSSH